MDHRKSRILHRIKQYDLSFNILDELEQQVNFILFTAAKMLIAAIFLLLVVGWLWYEFVGRRKGLPPGPMPLPFIGFFINYKSNAIGVC